MMNSTVRQLEDSIIELLNNSPVEVEIKRLILSDILKMTEREANNAISLEREVQEAQDAEST